MNAAVAGAPAVFYLVAGRALVMWRVGEGGYFMCFCGLTPKYDLKVRQKYCGEA